jgi:invasion protein IalB
MKRRDMMATTATGRALAFMALMVAAIFASHGWAQQPAPKAPAPKAQPKAPPPQQAPQPQQPAQPEQPKITYSPWVKVCPPVQDPNAKRICLTGRDGAVDSGMTVVAAVLIEPEGEPRKILRVTLPLGMALPPGTRVVIDQGQPMNAPYAICAGNGCMADYEASGELIANMKKGKGLAVQGIDGAGQPITLIVPLADFGKAHDGPPTDPKAFEEMQRKRFEEFQKKNKP